MTSPQNATTITAFTTGALAAILAIPVVQHIDLPWWTTFPASVVTGVLVTLITAALIKAVNR